MMNEFPERLSELMTDNKTPKEQIAYICGTETDTVRRWLKGDRLITLKHLLPIVEFFNCSFDYILGRSDHILNFTPQACPPFYEQIQEVLKICGKTKYKMKRDIQIYDSYYTNWKSGKSPHILTLNKIADYLGCTVDNLVGREKIE